VRRRLPLPPDVVEGVRLFNEGRYFEAHDAWEEHWGHGPKAERDLVKGLIKAAVGLHHLHHGNAVGFAVQVREALPMLRAGAGVWPELDVASLADDVESVAAQVRFHGKADAMPRIRLRE